MTFKLGQFRIPVFATFVSMTAIVIMLQLGFWQLDRAEQKKQRIQQIQKRQQEQPFTLGEILKLKGDIRDYPIEVQGHFIQEKQFLIDNRIANGQVGYHLVALFQTNWGIIPVNMGWLKAPATRDQLPNILLPDGQQTLLGTIAIPELNPMIRDSASKPNQWPARVQQIDIQQLQTLSKLSLLSLVLNAAPDPSQALIRQWQPVVMPPQKHIAYAIQWFGLALAALAIYLFALFKFNRDVHNE